MKVEQVMDRVRTTVGDTDALQFSNEQLLAWINDGVRECAIMNNLLQSRATSNSVVGQREYSIPTNILKLHSVMVDGSTVRMMTLQEFNQWYPNVDVTAQGVIEAAYVWAGKLNLHPAPDQVHPIVIDYLADPEPLLLEGISTQEVPLPVSYHPRIVDYCLAQVAQQDDDINRYNMKMVEFKTGVQGLQDQAEYTYDLYPSISISERDAGEGVELF